MKKIIFTIVFFVLLSNTFVFSQDYDFELFKAIEDQDDRKVFILLKTGSDANSETDDGVTPLMYAAEIGNIYIIKLLLKYDANINTLPINETSALTAATKTNNVEIVELLLQNGAIPNIKDNKGYTALMYAVAYGYPQTADILCFYGADINEKNEDTDAIMIAAYYGDNEIIDVLLEYKANINSKNFSGFTPLMIASQNGHLETVKYLINKGALIDKKNYDNLTALDIAVNNKHEAIIKFLISKGANPNNQISKTITTYDIAKAYGHDDIEKLIIGNTEKKSQLNIRKKSIGIVQNFNNKDYMPGIQFNIHEDKYNFDMSGEFIIRPFRKYIRIKERENFYYQYREHRSVFKINLKKRFVLNSQGLSKTGLYIATGGAYTFGNYRGSNKSFNEFLFIPSTGFYLHGSNFGCNLGYEYANYKPYNTNPHRINFTILFFFITTKNKFDFRKFTINDL